MTKSRIFTCILLLGSSFQTFAFSDTLKTSKTKPYKIVYRYSWGLYSAWGPENECVKDLKIKYGYDTKTKAGCLVSSGQRRRWVRHNKKVEKIMAKRHGENWSEKFELELNNCHEN